MYARKVCFTETHGQLNKFPEKMYSAAGCGLAPDAAVRSDRRSIPQSGKLKRIPDSLRNPGPNPSLAGDLQIMEDMSAQGQAQILEVDLLHAEARQIATADAL